jgi:hypothetical protein
MAEISVNKNKRKFQRTKIEIAVKYQPIKFRGWYSTITEGIGTDGLSLMTREYLGVGTTINIQLPLSRSNTTIFVSGTVLWSDFLIERQMYESGIKFVKLNSDDKEMISKQIEWSFRRSASSQKVIHM